MRGRTLAVLALPILASLPALRRESPGILRLPAALPLRSWGERLGCAAFLFVLTTHWFAMLKPEASADGLSMHLAVPANIAANHVMTFDPGRTLWAVMPMGADFIYSIVYVLGGEMAARLLNFAILLVLLGLLHAAVRRWVSPACRLAAGHPLRHHADRATGHRLSVRGESAGRVVTRHDDSALALRRDPASAAPYTSRRFSAAPPWRPNSEPSPSSRLPWSVPRWKFGAAGRGRRPMGARRRTPAARAPLRPTPSRGSRPAIRSSRSATIGSTRRS